MESNELVRRYRDPDTFDVRGTVERVTTAARYYKGLVFSVALALLVLTAIYVYAWPPIYKVEATLVAERDTDPARDAFYTTWNIFRKDDARTEIELISSAGVLADVVKNQHLSYDDVYHPITSQLTYFWEKSWIGRNYKAAKAAVFGGEKQDLPPDQILLGKTVSDLAQSITVSPVGDSTMGKLTVKGPNKKVTDIANAILDTYLRRRVQTHVDEATQSFSILQNAAAQARVDLEAAGRRRVAFAQANGLTFDFQREVQQVKQRTDLEGSIATERAKVATLQSTLKQLDAQLAKEPATRTITQNLEVNSVREAAKMKRLETEAALISARDKFRESSPEVQALAGDLAKLDLIIARSDERIQRGETVGLNQVQQQLLTSRNSTMAELQGESAGLAAMERTDAQLGQTLENVPGRQNTLRDLDRDYTTTQERFQTLTQKAEEAQVSIATAKASMPSVRVVDYAAPAGGKYWPKTKLLYPAVFIVGLALGVFAALLKLWLRGRVLRIDLVQNGVPIYSTLSIHSGALPLTVLAPRPMKALEGSS